MWAHTGNPVWALFIEVFGFRNNQEHAQRLIRTKEQVRRLRRGVQIASQQIPPGNYPD